MSSIFRARPRVPQLIMAVLIAGCLSPYDMRTEYEGGQLIIYGQISTLPEVSTVYVGRTASGLQRLPEAEMNAHVALVDESGTAYPLVADSELQRYVSDKEGIPGETYRITVTLPDGRTYESLPERLPRASGIDNVRYEIVREQYTDGEGTVGERDFVKIYTDHTLADTSETAFVRWHVEEVYSINPTDFPDPFGHVPPACYVSQLVEPQRIVLFNGEINRTRRIPGVHIASRLLDTSFKERHYFTVYRSYLTRGAFEYWSRVNVIANQTGSIFDAPPANIRGNIVNTADAEEAVLGYFQAVNQAFERFYLLPDDLPYGMPLHCEFRSYRELDDYPRECLDCTTVRNSSYNRPPWF